MASPTSPSGADVPPVLPSIPLAPETATPAHDQSIGGLVREVTTHLSTLVRSEIELAKVELTAEIKTGARGAIFFIVAGAIGLFSLFFFFFMLAEIIAIWLPQWAAFTIVFFLMVLMAGALAFLGYRKVKQIGKPERTISTLTDSAAVLKAAATHTEPTVAA